jgi:hypothetical protein
MVDHPCFWLMMLIFLLMVAVGVEVDDQINGLCGW